MTTIEFSHACSFDDGSIATTDLTVDRWHYLNSKPARYIASTRHLHLIFPRWINT